MKKFLKMLDIPLLLYQVICTTISVFCAVFLFNKLNCDEWFIFACISAIITIIFSVIYAVSTSFYEAVVFAQNKLNDNHYDIDFSFEQTWKIKRNTHNSCLCDITTVISIISIFFNENMVVRAIVIFMFTYCSFMMVLIPNFIYKTYKILNALKKM